MLKQLLCPLLLLMSFKNFAQTKDTVYYDQKINGVWHTTVLNELIYNDNCIIDQRLSKTWDEPTQSWINASRSKDKYDDSGNFIETLEESWNQTTQSWNKSSRYIQSISSDGLTTSYGFQFWDNFMGIWINTYRATNIHNITGDSIVTVFDFYINYAWQNSSKSLIVLNKDKIVQEAISEIWQNNAWVKSRRQLYTYTDNNSKALYNEFIWNTAIQDWVLWYRSKITYYQPGMQEKEYISQTFTNNEWQFLIRSKSTFNGMDMKTSFVHEVWDTNASLWMKNLRNGYTYYKDGASKTSVTEFYDTSAKAWINGFRVRSTHNGCLISATLQENDVDDQFNILKDRLRTFSSKGHTTVLASLFLKDNKAVTSNKKKQTVFITLSKNKSISTSTAVQLAQKTPNVLSITPNPAKNYFILSLKYDVYYTAELKITDMTGKIVLRQALSSNNAQKINISGIKKGVYIVTVISGKSIFDQKLIVQ